ncbi:MAG: PorP/SprF family type IX secretion system membrane protein [Chitinophagales bacterium]|nr:PorP/SprF family type IX secretion system membrane protein [Chitinophagales bacterium]
MLKSIARYFLVFFCCLSATASLQAQDAEFSQFFAAPLHLNPAMIGFSPMPRVVVNFRDQYPSFNQGYITLAASYDQHFDKLNSSFGGSVFADRTGSGIYNTYYLTGFYAYQLHLNENLLLKAGLQASYLQQNLNWDKVILGDMIDPLTGEAIIPSGEDLPLRETLHRPDFGAGILAYNEKFYIGASVKHVSRPNLSFTTVADSDNRLPVRSSIHAGYTFYVGAEKFMKSRFYVMPNILLINQGKFNQINAGVYAGKGIIFGGLQFRHTMQNPDAFITTIGVRKDIVQVGYSYDFTVSNLNTNAGAHEISVMLDFGNTQAVRDARKRKKTAECPALFGQ